LRFSRKPFSHLVIFPGPIQSTPPMYADERR
jgi:hypothetical protein